MPAVVAAAAANNEKEASLFVPEARWEKRGGGDDDNAVKYCTNSLKFIRNLDAPPFRTRCHFLCSPKFTRACVSRFIISSSLSVVIKPQALEKSIWSACGTLSSQPARLASAAWSLNSLSLATNEVVWVRRESAHRLNYSGVVFSPPQALMLLSSNARMD